MKATGAIWGFALALIPILLALVPILRDNGWLTGAAAALALGILNLWLKYMQENKPAEPLAPTSTNASRAMGIPAPEAKRESLMRRVLLG